MNMPLHRSGVQPEQHCESHYHWLHPRSTRTECPCKDNKKHCKLSQIPFFHLQIKHCIQQACPVQNQYVKKASQNSNKSQSSTFYRERVLVPNRQKLRLAWKYNLGWDGFRYNSSYRLNSILIRQIFVHSIISVSPKQGFHNSMNSAK